MSVYALSHVWKNSPHKSGTLLVLLALADFADDDTGECYPSIATLARKSRLGERQVQYCLRELVESGEISIEEGSGPYGCNTFTVFFEGAKNAPPRLKGVNSTSQWGELEFGKEVQSTAPKPSVEPSKKPSVKPPAKAGGTITFQTFIENCQQTGEKPISAYRPVFDFAEKAGIPQEFVEIAWNEFYRRHAKGGTAETKRQKDWRHTFRNCVEGNWYKLWWLNEADQKYGLTTQGMTAKRVAA